MKPLDALTDLTERGKWMLSAYREAAHAYTTVIEGFAKAVSKPRLSGWKNDPIFFSFLKFCDTQATTLQNIQKVSQIVSNNLEIALELASQGLAQEKERDALFEEERTKYYACIETGVKKRAEALKGAADIWKADFDLRNSIQEYVAKETGWRREQGVQEARYEAIHSRLLCAYNLTLHEYMCATKNHMNILLCEVSEIAQTALTPPGSEVIEHPVPCPRLLRTPEEEHDRFEDIYRQAIADRETTSGLYPFLIDLSIRGCGVFYLTKPSKSNPVFLVYTSTEYIHAFSVARTLDKVSEDLFIKSCPQNPADGFLSSHPPHQLSMQREDHLEEMNKHLLDNIQHMKAIEKNFPILVKDACISLSSGGKEITIDCSSSRFFSNKTRLIGVSSQQIRKFYLLINPQGPASSPQSASEAGSSELVVTWSATSFDNPW
ncbi:hypothetical protein NEDG_00971 [Nematocida displodere]|uniref:Uncharacterized protein n=1 Tax=Nematocida displodere TaxID=1805483 RepID=A0A177ECE2_9MICR|nr:hypothetical protein NEDG_00971 [Nematocida displodere]